jgi:spore coat polysaccharide biosynthesis protein SpsF
VIQARVSSTRLPGKVLLPLAGRTLLERQIERIRAAKSPFELCVATTTSSADDSIRELCRRASVPAFSGHPTDLLERHYLAGVEYRADAVVKIPSDCPLIDPDAIDRVLGLFRDRGGALDFVTNLYPPTWPDGNDVEVMTMDALACAFENAERTFEREHTTPFIWERPDRFRIANVPWETGLDLSKTHRFTVDHPEDFWFVSRVYRELHSERQPVFSLSQILELLRAKPEIAALNARFLGQSWHMEHAAELKHYPVQSAHVTWGAL